MYTPDVFMIDEPLVIREFILANGFATLAVPVDGEIALNHVPMLLEDDGTPWGVLRGHVARVNPLARVDLAGVRGAVAVFQGPHAYVCANLYPSTREHGRMVPTWNYTVAHVRGDLRLVDDAQWLAAQIGALSAQYEDDRAAPWRPTDAPADYIASLSRGVIGIEMTIRDVQCKWKLSQNQSRADFDGVVDGMIAEGRDEIVDYMRRVNPRGAG